MNRWRGTEGRSGRFLVFRLILAISFSLPLHATGAETLWAGSFEKFCANAEPIGQNRLQTIFRSFYAHFQRDAGRVKTLRRARFSDLDQVLAKAVERGFSTIDLFTDAELVGSDCALLLDRDTLTAIDRRYDLRSVWQIEATGPNAGPALSMQFLVLGGGRFVLGYDRSAEAEVDDGTGSKRRYRYDPYVVADIVNQKARRGLFNIRSLVHPDDPDAGFEGPFGAEIHGFSIEDGQIRVDYTFGFDQTSLAPKNPIERRAGPERSARP